ncbi:MAG: enoyl-CoA hydratase/isomerase family protein [Deltaproteobacteria bacterium]|nr:enoyl-CoA hydratase/isomerase family protein [Deltaproteobacteria bacterium]
MSTTILQERTDDGKLILTLNRPHAMNCMNFEMIESLESIVRESNYDMSIRLILVKGADPPEGKKPSFSAGADLIERLTLSEDQVRRFIGTVRNTMITVENSRVPTIAVINGYAFGGGTELALACDLRIASTEALMGLTETSLAVIPGGGGTQRLSRIIGIAKAKELIYTARRIDAVTALKIGLVNKVSDPKHLMNDALELAGEITRNGPVAVQQAKFALNYGSECSIGVALHIESKAYEIIIPTEDRMEALKAFAEKRKPEFKGR